MSDFRVGYLYSLAPIHCGGEGDLGNILEIAREVHTNFPYLPGSSLRGSLRDEVKNFPNPDAEKIANRLFGKELDNNGQMGVHQVWFGDSRLLWVPMRTMATKADKKDAFTWVSCHSLIRDHALVSRQPKSNTRFPDHAVGTISGTYLVADAELKVAKMSEEQTQAINLTGAWAEPLQELVQETWNKNRIVLPDDDFQVLMEHSLWTQVRNKIQESGSAEVFWTDVCIPRDTIFYFVWGYSPFTARSINASEQKTLLEPINVGDHKLLMDVLQGLLQVGGQANVGRGWVQSWVANNQFITNRSEQIPESIEV